MRRDVLKRSPAPAARSPAPRDSGRRGRRSSVGAAYRWCAGSDPRPQPGVHPGPPRRPTGAGSGPTAAPVPVATVAPRWCGRTRSSPSMIGRSAPAAGRPSQPAATAPCRRAGAVAVVLVSGHRPSMPPKPQESVAPASRIPSAPRPRGTAGALKRRAHTYHGAAANRGWPPARPGRRRRSRGAAPRRPAGRTGRRPEPGSDHHHCGGREPPVRGMRRA